MKILKAPLLEKLLYVCLLIGIFCWFVSQLHLFIVPDSDFFSYLSEAARLLDNPFTLRAMSPPLYSLIVYGFQMFLPVKHPGIIGGTVFNIACFILSLWFLWLLSKQWLGAWSWVVVIVLAVNPLSRFVNLQPINLPLATLLVIAATYYSGKRRTVSYILVLLACLARFESVGLFFGIVLMDVLAKRRLRYPLWLLVGILSIESWYLFPRSTKDNYFVEMIARHTEIPNITFLKRSFVLVPYVIGLPPSATSQLTVESIALALASFGWMIGGIIYCIKQKLFQLIVLFCYVFIYCFIHLIFPDSVFRYSYPILPFIYVLLSWPVFAVSHLRLTSFKKYILYLVMCVVPAVILFNAFTNGQQYLENQRLVRSERRLVAEWFNANVQSPSVIYTFEYWVPQYYSDNPMVRYADTVRFDSWTKGLCLEKDDVYVIIDSQTNLPGAFFDYANGQGYFEKIQQSPAMLQNFTLVETITIEHRWAKIYKLQKVMPDWCRQFAR